MTDLIKIKHETYSMGLFITQSALGKKLDCPEQLANELGVTITEYDNGVLVQTQQEIEDCEKYGGLP